MPVSGLTQAAVRTGALSQRRTFKISLAEYKFVLGLVILLAKGSLDPNRSHTYVRRTGAAGIAQAPKRGQTSFLAVKGTA